MIITTSEIPTARNFFTFRYFSLYEQLKFRAQLRMKRTTKAEMRLVHVCQYYNKLKT